MSMRDIILFIMLGVSSFCMAQPGPLVTVTGTGGQAPFNIIVWLNGNSRLSGQQFTVTGGTTITITPTHPTQVYPAIGLEVVTPGLTINAGCTQYTGNRCIFSASHASPAIVTVSGTSTPAIGCANQAGGICRVFVTSTTMTGNITTGAISATGTAAACPTGDLYTRANCICNSDGNYPGSGTFRAWISSPTVNASTNIQYDNTTLWSYVKAANTSVIIADPGQLTTPPLANSISTTGGDVWTGTSSNGSYSTVYGSCQVWTSSDALGDNALIGVKNNTTFWTNGGPDNCNFQLPLYCFEIP